MFLGDVKIIPDRSVLAAMYPTPLTPVLELVRSPPPPNLWCEADQNGSPPGFWFPPLLAG